MIKERTFVFKRPSTYFLEFDLNGLSFLSKINSDGILRVSVSRNEVELVG